MSYDPTDGDFAANLREDERAICREAVEKGRSEVDSMSSAEICARRGNEERIGKGLFEPDVAFVSGNRCEYYVVFTARGAS